MTEKHGHTEGGKSPTYLSWASMIARCTYKSTRGFVDYGGGGVGICDRWRNFANFLADMGERPDGKTLDRHPNGRGAYEPGNCRWATPREQVLNRKTTVWIEIGGETKCLKDWALQYGRSTTTIRARISKGWDLAAAVTTPPEAKHSASALCRALVQPSTAHSKSEYKRRTALGDTNIQPPGEKI